MSLAERGKTLARLCFWDPRALYAAIGVPLVALWLSWFIPVSQGQQELRVRAAGALVTLAGVVLVASGIIERQREFDQPTVRQRVWAWAIRVRQELYPSRRNVVVVAGTGRLTALGLSATATVGTARTPTLEERVSALEKNLGEVSARLDEAENGRAKRWKSCAARTQTSGRNANGPSQKCDRRSNESRLTVWTSNAPASSG